MWSACLQGGRTDGRTDRHGEAGFTLEVSKGKEEAEAEEGLWEIRVGCSLSNMWPDTVNILTHMIK